MSVVVNTIFKGLLAAFLVLAAAEIISRGSAANFLPMAGLSSLLFLAAIASICYPEASREKVYPLLSVLLTLVILGATIVFTWKIGRELGKINWIIVLGAATIVAGALKEIFSSKE